MSTVILRIADNRTIPSNIKNLIDQQIPEKYIPAFEYYKIIEKDIPDETLLKLQNLVSIIRNSFCNPPIAILGVLNYLGDFFLIICYFRQ